MLRLILPAVAVGAALFHLYAAGVSPFTALVQRHERSLINFFFHFCWDRQMAEDCAQEVFVKLYKHLDSYEPKALRETDEPTGE